MYVSDFLNLNETYLLFAGEFVKMHHLDEGDLLILYKDQQGNFVSTNTAFLSVKILFPDSYNRRGLY